MQNLFFNKVPSCAPDARKILVLLRSTPNLSIRFSSAMAKESKRVVRRNEALKKYGLSDLNLDWPKAARQKESVDYQIRNPRSIRQMYGNADLSQLPVFQGGFINFGYWPNSMLEKITPQARIASSKEMYRLVGDMCDILKKSNVLDVGCGLGYGSSFISQNYLPKLVVGVDISSEQIARAKKHQISGVSSGDLRFTIGEAESLPFPNGSFDCIVSIEAAQHFSRINDFSKEISRILKPGGKCVVTSFFPTNQEGVDALNAIVPDYHIHGSQNTVEDVKKALAEHMTNVQVRSIGKNVWYGFSTWLDQIGYQHQWSKIWCALYEKGLIDYVIYESEVPAQEYSVQQKNVSLPSFTKV